MKNIETNLKKSTVTVITSLDTWGLTPNLPEKTGLKLLAGASWFAKHPHVCWLSSKHLQVNSLEDLRSKHIPPLVPQCCTYRFPPEFLLFPMCWMQNMANLRYPTKETHHFSWLYTNSNIDQYILIYTYTKLQEIRCIYPSNPFLFTLKYAVGTSLGRARRTRPIWWRPAWRARF